MNKVNLSITERQAELVLSALRVELKNWDSGCRDDCSNAQYIRAMIQNIKDELYRIQIKDTVFAGTK